MKGFKAALLALAAVHASAGLASAQQKLTMWSRSSSQAFMPELVKAFNASYKTQIELQIVPNTEVVQKYAIAAPAARPLICFPSISSSRPPSPLPASSRI